MGFDGFRVLVVEGEPLVGLDLFDILTQVGCHVIGPERTVVAAVQSIDVHRPDIVILDQMLADGDSAPVADALAARDIPFMWLTDPSQEIIPHRHSARPAVSKPFTVQSLFSGLAFATVVRGASAISTGNERPT